MKRQATTNRVPARERQSSHSDEKRSRETTNSDENDEQRRCKQVDGRFERTGGEDGDDDEEVELRPVKPGRTFLFGAVDNV